MEREADRADGDTGKIPFIVIRQEDLGLDRPYRIQFSLAELLFAILLLGAQGMLGAWLGKSYLLVDENVPYEILLALVFGGVALFAILLGNRIGAARGIQGLRKRILIMLALDVLLLLPPAGPILIVLIGKMHGLWRGRLKFLNPEP